MQPLALTLKGFRGIRDGLGRDEITLDLERLTQDAQLIAIVGANGSGKSTIMDCLVPYIGLPSRAALAGAGGFSYYDHVYLPESVKDLTWAHEGRCYRSQIVIRLCGRRRTEAFLHTLDDAGHWRPVQLDDGMVSDGRVETYTRCVEAICGSAETFFTSVFAAQGKRQLSTYRNAEIKSLLADLLGQEEIQALGQKAAETVRLLKAGLATIRQELVGLDAEGVRLEATRRRLDGAGERMAAAERAKTAAHAALEAAQARHARVAVEREQSRATEARRAQLAAERQSTLDTTAQARRALQSRDQAERQRLERLDQRVAGRLQQERSRRQALTLSRQRCQAVLAEAGEVQRADRRLPLAQRVQALRSALTEACRQQTHALTRCQGAVRLAEHRVAGIEQEAGRAALKAEELARRFGLTGEVPCVGTDLQGRCKLLGDAREAQSLIPNAHAQLARLAVEKAAALCEGLPGVTIVQADLLENEKVRFYPGFEVIGLLNGGRENRVAGVRTRRIAMSFALFNILVLFSRTSNSFLGPFLAKRIETRIHAGSGASTSVYQPPAPGQISIVTELVEGRRLSEILAAVEPMSRYETCILGRKECRDEDACPRRSVL